MTCPAHLSLLNLQNCDHFWFLYYSHFTYRVC
jgi:hypothetical protein